MQEKLQNNFRVGVWENNTSDANALFILYILLSVKQKSASPGSHHF
jgi:hypothetical protein